MKNILIVDDDLDTCLRYKRCLEEEGLNVTLINDPEFAEENFRSKEYDIVLIIGFRMSVMDGFDVYNRLHGISKMVKTHLNNFKYAL